ncbi:MAG: DUF1343 domain-containing protein [Candidatus Marinimicrobia bacterium]|nr:DUF1343 domain-containing protein [Candidatus Neomarinimicrobiota bacterium]
MRIFFFSLFLSFLFTQEHPSTHQTQSEKYKGKPVPSVDIAEVRTGLDVLLSDSLHIIQGKSIALVTNQTGIDQNGTPNYERLMNLDNINLKVIFSPEHGLFGEAAAGEKVSYGVHEIELPTVISLYGKNRKPTSEMLKDVDIILYDIQDIGARFYTYITTCGLVMEAAGELGIPVVILDRPNPIRGDRIEGPILNKEYQSFVGYYPIPIQYGLTIGELAQMIIGENWIDSKPTLSVVQVEGWTRQLWFDETTLPWVLPSPNIPDLETAIVYPGMCLIEATNVSEGRGTLHPFQQFGAPWIDAKILSQALNKKRLPGVVFSPISFTPTTIPGMANNPKYENELCHGIEIHITDRNQYQSILVGISIISTIDELYPEDITFNEKWFAKLWGSDSWKDALQNIDSETILYDTNFDELRNKYILY